MRSNWRSNRLTFLFVMVALCGCMIVTSIVGTLAPAESVLATPLTFITGAVNSVSQDGGQLFDDLTEIRDLRERNHELERQLARLQAEAVALREIENDYNRLAALLDYDAPSRNQDTIAADVIANYDATGSLNTIIVNRGSRDGVERGMAVVTQAGLVGRITEVFATASRVLLVTDPSSSISARLQSTRAVGSVRGLLTGGLRIEFIPLEDEVQVGDLVVTSGLGGNLPSDIPIGQVTSRRQFENELNQEAEIRSFIDFDRLEIVMIVTSFEPVDVTEFDDDEES
jgi:rod shape-determining protein MreC